MRALLLRIVLVQMEDFTTIMRFGRNAGEVLTFGLLSIVAYSVYAQYNYNGWSSNCLINYCPSFLYPYIPNVFLNLLASLAFSDVSILLNALAGYTTFPNFLSSIQSQSLPLYNALNGVNNAYGGSFFPFLESTFNSPSFQPFVQQLSGGGTPPPSRIPNGYQPPFAQPAPQPIGGSVGGGGGSGGSQSSPASASGGGGGFNLGNFLQPIAQGVETAVDEVVEDETEVEDTEEGGGYNGNGNQGFNSQAQQGGGVGGGGFGF